MSLAEKIEAGRQASIQAQRSRDAAREAERQNQREELDRAKKEQEEYLKEQERLEKEIAELNRLEADEQKRLQLETQRQESFEAGRQAIEQKYKSQIDQLKSERADYADPKKNPNISQSVIRNINSRISQLEDNYSRELQLYEFSARNPGKTIPTSVLKQFEGSSTKGVSLAKLVEEKEISAEQTRLANIRASQATAQSEAIKARNELEQLKREFAGKRERGDSYLGAQTASYNIQFETSKKKIPGKRLSKPFEGLPDIDAESIYGTTREKSEKAVYTFEQTQQQQAELERLIRGAKSAKEAKEIRAKFQAENPYVGTPNIYQYKGKTLDTQGLTIEKELNTAIDNFEKMQAKEPVKPQKDYLVELEENLDIGTSLGGTVETTPRISTERQPRENITAEEIVFIDSETGKDLKDQVPAMFAKTMQNLEIAEADFLPSKATKKLAKYEQENLEELAKFELTERAKESGRTEPLVDRSKLSVESGFIGAADEIADMARGVQTEKPSIETLAFSDLANEVKAGLGLEQRKEKESVKVFEERLRTPEGQAWLTGSLAGSAVAAAATVVIPGTASVKVGKLLGKQTLKEATTIAEKLATKAPDERFIAQRTTEITKELTKKFPALEKTEAERIATSMLKSPDEKALEKLLRESTSGISPSKAGEILRKTAEKEPYTVELLDRKTALIAIGSETSPTTRVIVYQKRINQFALFEGPSERMTVFKNILLKNAYSDKETIKRELLKQFPDLAKTPAGKAELEKQASQLSKDLEFGRQFISAKEARMAQKQNPLLKETREKVSIGGKEYRVLRGTDAPNYEKTNYSTYRPTKTNLRKLQDTTTYAFIGTIKTGRASDLLKFPKAVVESIEKEDPLKATAIFERATRQKPTTTPAKSEKPFGTDKIEIPGRKRETITTSKQTTTLDELKKLAKESTPTKTIDTEINTGLQGLAAGLQTETKSSVRFAEEYRTSQQQNYSYRSASTSDIKYKTGQLYDEIQIPKSKFKINTDDIQIIKTAESSRITTKDRLTLSGLYSLLVSRGLKQTELEQLKFRIVQKQKLITKLDIPGDTPTKAPPKTPVRRPFPYKVEVYKKNKLLGTTKIRKGKLFFRWNVNELSPGYYLPTKELTTGRTRKAITKVERIQRKEARRKITFKLK